MEKVSMVFNGNCFFVRNERIFVVIPLQPTGSHEQRNQRNRAPVTLLLHITNMAYPVVSFPVTSDNNNNNNKPICIAP